MSYHLVQYLKRTAGGWQSPPAMEACVQAKACLQARFDNSSGVALIKCKAKDCLGHGEEIDAKSDILPWLDGLVRLPKTADKDGNVTARFSAADEEANIKDLARNFE